MASCPLVRAAAGALVEGALLGGIGAVLPLPVPLLTVALLVLFVPLTLLRAPRVESFVASLARLGGCMVISCIASALPLKPLDARLHLPAEPTVADVLYGLQSAGIRTRAPPQLPRAIRVDLPRDPRAR